MTDARSFDLAVQEILAEAIQLPEAELASFLERRCGGNDTLRTEVESLLAFRSAAKTPVYGKHNPLLGRLQSVFRHAGSGSLNIEAQADVDELFAGLRERRASFSRYEVRGELGRGGMGVVEQVWDKDLDRDLALKRSLVDLSGSLPPDPQGTSTGSMRLLREARITARLEHPGVVPVHEIGLDDDGHPYFTMQRVEGRSLDTVIENMGDRGSEWSLVRVLSEVHKAGQALAFAHSRGIIHRDVKPANIVIGPHGKTYLVDWGLAKTLNEGAPGDTGVDAQDSAPSSEPTLTLEGSTLGTPVYMPPEQASGDHERVSTTSDIYSLGAVLYHVLAGHPPYLRKGSRLGKETLLGLVRSQPPAPIARAAPRSPSELHSICARAMEREPSQRYASMDEFVEDLQAFLENRVVRAHRTGPLIELRKWVGRNRTIAILAVLSLVALSIVGLNAYQAKKAQDRLLLSAAQEVRWLESRADELWPIRPALVESYNEWIRGWEELIEKLPVCEARLQELTVSNHDNVDGGAAGVAETRSLGFDTWAESFRFERLTELVSELHRISDPDRGWLDGVSEAFGFGMRRRLESIERIVELSLGQEVRPRWADAIEEIQSHPHYGGLKLEPQWGLVPLGPDPLTSLWEFADVSTGTLPRRDEATGKLQLPEDSSVVFVLLPSHTVLAGWQSSDPDERHYLPDAFGGWKPVSVSLDAFFLSKYEMTRAQWLALTGEDPNAFKHDGPERPFSMLHPVEMVSWESCTKVMRRQGWKLPSHAQWGYAYCAGTDTGYWTGSDPETLHGTANLLDKTAMIRNPRWGFAFDDIDDGGLFHLPVDAFDPNPWGFHNIHGNVSEWISDSSQEPFDLTPGSGERNAKQLECRFHRGGTYRCYPPRLRADYVNDDRPEFVDSNVGLRPARQIDLFNPYEQWGLAE